MVTTSELKVKTGAWCWKEDNPAPAWKVLEHAKFHTMPKYDAIKEAFATPKMTVSSITSTNENLQSFNVKRRGFEKNMTVIPGLADIPEEVRSLKLRCALWRVTDPTHRPPLLLEAITNGVPLLICGEHTKLNPVMTFIKDTFKTIIVVPIQIFVKTKVAPLGSRHRQLPLEAQVVAIENTIRGQVCTVPLWINRVPSNVLQSEIFLNETEIN